MTHPIYDARLDQMPIAVFDLETTGLFAHSDRIIQVAVVHVDGAQIGEKWSSLVYPGDGFHPISDWLSDYTGISNDDLKDAPPEDVVFPDFAARVGTRIIAGHNIKSFDIPFVRKAEGRHGVDAQTQYYFDTIKVMRKLHPDLDGYKLSDCATFYDLDFDAGALHDALVDTTLTADVMLKQIEDLGGRDVYTFGEMIGFLT